MGYSLLRESNEIYFFQRKVIHKSLERKQRDTVFGEKRN